MKTGCSLLLFAAVPCVALLAQSPRSVWAGVYTQTQAERGGQLYKRECSYCHRDDLRGGFIDDGVGNAPALAGSRAFGSSFTERWMDLSVGEMVATIAETMPQAKPASLSLQSYVDIVTFLLSKNDVPPGNSELPTDIQILGDIQITAKP
jgi:cytochrome c